jgi:peptidoglycan/xylan/chitin deacetylase (PgdA/CDA1 family)
MKKNKFIIVMYHHVRKKNENFFPKLNSLDYKIFIKQLDYLEKNYRIVNFQDLIDFFVNKKKFKKKLCMLTFDDGYLNHYTNVFPELKKRKLQGFFFPPSKAILERKLMDSNKAHLLLASNTPVKKLNKELEKIFYELELEKKIKKSFSDLIRVYKKPFGFDDSETIFFKRFTQHILPERFRNKVLKNLIKKFVKKSENYLAKHYYFTKKQAQEMVSNGMIFGNHCHDHLWLEKVNEKTQKLQIEKGLKFLKLIGMDLNRWIMCYPYGSYNNLTLKILKNKKCFLALTSVNKPYNNTNDQIYKIPRIDCNNVFEYK